MLKKLIFLGSFILMISCGSGGDSFYTSKDVFFGAEIKNTSLDVSVLNLGLEETDIVFSVNTRDIFRRDVYFDKVKLVYKDFFGNPVREVEYPLGFSLSTGQTKNTKLVYLSTADKMSVPYVYLNPVNPTTLGASYLEEVIARPLTLVLGQGSCWKERMCSGQSCTDVEVCNRNFTGTFPQDIQVGTCRVIAGDKSVEERTFGVLEGAGSGIVQGNTIIVSFTEGPKTGVYVVAKCLSRFIPINRAYTSLKFVYGDTVYEVGDGNLIKDSKGQIVGEIVGGNIRFYSALGAKDFPFVAFYYHSPSVGGELMAYSDGSTVYRLRTRYAPIDPLSVKVVGGGDNISLMAQIQHVDAVRGEITFTFSRPLPAGMPIYVQYRVTEIFQRVDVYVYTNLGSRKVAELNLRVKR